MPPLSKVIIVGAGPAGLLLALLLSKAGIAVDILEKEIKPTDEARAVIYQPISLYEFERAGIKDSFLDAALSFRSIGVRKIDGEKVFEMPGGYEQYALSVKELLPIIQRHLEREEGAKIHWGHRVTGVGQDGSGEWVDVETPEGRKRFTGDYVVGCDGGQSIVRRTVFGEEALKGFTWEQELVAADVSDAACFSAKAIREPGLTYGFPWPDRLRLQHSRRSRRLKPLHPPYGRFRPLPCLEGGTASVEDGVPCTIWPDEERGRRRSPTDSERALGR